MNDKDAVFNALKEILMLLVAVVSLSIAALLFFEKPISRWRQKFLGW